MTCFLLSILSDHQKLEREARICRLLKHPNIGECLAESGSVSIGGRENRGWLVVCVELPLVMDLHLVSFLA